MVTEQLQARGITDPRLLEAFLEIPRHTFVDDAVASRAYEDCSYPIGYSQTISQPYTIAFMIQTLGIEKNHRILEIGTGSGYQTAILSLMAAEVYSIERISSLSEQAEAALMTIRTGRIRLKTGDGSLGWKHYAPFDRIIVSAVASDRPDALLEQLGNGGMLIAPVVEGSERLILYKKNGIHITEQRLSRCAFVPLRKGVV
jgi:protein-L-isoaspartate(D-aspartate) O-methyltransferase